MVLLFINYYIIFHMNNGKPAFAPPFTLTFGTLCIHIVIGRPTNIFLSLASGKERFPVLSFTLPHTPKCLREHRHATMHHLVVSPYIQ